jgi:predicted nucleotidyltransferase component of viral defense system
MISKQEIIEQAKKHNLVPNTIEKDYVLNWLLAGISESKQLKNDWVFKGGTCLKKCYFESYRFSEDLDFTIKNIDHRDVGYLKTVFSDIASWIYEQVGLVFPENEIHFELYETPRGQLSIQGKTAYKGPMQRRGNNSTIKLDLCWDEILVEEPVKKRVYHPYSDSDFDFRVQAYCIEEIFSEKLRALVERMRPRDLYDIVHLFNDSRWSLDRKKIQDVLGKKCRYKNVNIPTMSLVDSHPDKLDLNSDWYSMLSHQIYALESPAFYWKQLPGIFSWLYS